MPHRSETNCDRYNPIPVNEDEQYVIESKRLAKAITGCSGLKHIPIGYCLATWDVHGHMHLLAEKIDPGIWSLRQSRGDSIALDVLEIEVMVLHWSMNAAQLCDDPEFLAPWATSALAF